MKKLFLTLILITPKIIFGQDLTDKINSIVHKYDSISDYNGIIIVGLNPTNILTFQYGYKDVEKESERISMNDKFDLASLTKQFTGLAILQLIDKKRINENDSIFKYLPELKPKIGNVTIRQLANHTNGIHDFYSLTQRHDTLDNQKVLNILSQIDTTVFEPGTKWGYSNSGYLLLSTIVERVSKMTFQDYCFKNILFPLGMKSSIFAPADNVLNGFDFDLKPLKYNAFSSGESGLYATGNDIMSYYKNVSKSKKWRKYFTLAKKLSDKSNTENWDYGFGWFYTVDSLGEFRAHSGRNNGADTYIRWYDNDVFICLLSNKRLSYFKELREEISNLIIEETK